MSSKRTALLIPVAERMLRDEAKERMAALEFLAKVIAQSAGARV